MAGKLRIKLVRSTIGCPQDQRATARSLGLGRMQKTVVHNDTPQVRGMVFKIKHLVEVVSE
jgi:large subunit ribosomal protein L30